MSTHDYHVPNAPPRHQRASPLWSVGAVALAAFVAMAVSLPRLSPVYGLGAQVGGRLGGYIAEALVGVPVGALIAWMIWSQVNWSRFERLPKYFSLVFIGWTVGMALGTILTLDLDDPTRNAPPPSGAPIEFTYWRARVDDVNGYQRDLNADAAALRRLPPAAARERLQGMRGKLAAARARNTGALTIRQAELSALARNQVQRRALLVGFDERVRLCEAGLQDLWEAQSRRLDDMERAVARGARGELTQYRTELAVWEVTARLNGLLNSFRALPGAPTGLPQFETEMVSP